MVCKLEGREDLVARGMVSWILGRKDLEAINWYLEKMSSRKGDLQ